MLALMRTKSDYIEDLAEAIGALPCELTVEQAGAVLDLLLKRDAERPSVYKETIRAIGMLAPKLAAGQAAAAYNYIAKRLDNVSGLEELVPTVEALAFKLTTQQAEEILAIARYGLANSQDDIISKKWAVVIDTILQMRSGPDHLVGVSSVLKFPTAAGDPSDVLLAGLRRRFTDAPDENSGIRKTITWMQGRLPEVDLGSRPVRPLHHDQNALK